MQSLSFRKPKSRFRRRRHVDVRRPYPQPASDNAATEERASPRKVYLYKPRGRRTSPLVNKVSKSFSWHTVGVN
ncbi:hypothetical protein OCL06_02360 [Alteromonas sp. ASW11-19]|uniref:Uncharacterized protein n=1 Tax=Alteromonas salexigens TaxID=2982530 RepID=A0ABT2VJM0_9ALTE|nr:hypothetical protein [Alteromonas salexigens]MCU7553437.1 hypothetical protein [Alteromonas salexigens]